MLHQLTVQHRGLAAESDAEDTGRKKEGRLTQQLETVRMVQQAGGLRHSSIRKSSETSLSMCFLGFRGKKRELGELKV